MALNVRKDGTWVTIGSKGNGSVKATASGAISSGDPVILNNDATVSKITESSTAVSSPIIGGSGPSYFIGDDFKGGRVVYMPNGDYYIVVYSEGKYLKARTVRVDSEGTITYGDVSQQYVVADVADSGLSDNNPEIEEINLVYNPDADCVLVFCRVEASNNSPNYNRLRTLHLGSKNRGASLQWASNNIVHIPDTSSTTQPYGLCIDYNKGIKRYMMMYRNDYNGKTVIRIGSTGLTSPDNLDNYSAGAGISWSDATEVSDILTRGLNIAADTTNSFVLMWRQVNGGGGKSVYARAISVNDTTPTLGTLTNLGSDVWFNNVSNSHKNMICFNEEDQRFVVIFEQGSTTNGEYYINTLVLTLSNGTTISFDDFVLYTNHLGSNSYGYIGDYASLVYDPYIKKVFAHWEDTMNGDKLTINQINVPSDTSLNLGPKTKYINIAPQSITSLDVVNGGGGGGGKIGMTRFVAAGKNNQLILWDLDDYGGRVDTIKTTNTTTTLTESNFLGFSEDTYADNDTARINIIGSINTNQSKLEIGEKYYVQGDDSIWTTPGDPDFGNPRVEAGVALSETNLLINGDSGVLNSIEGTPVPPFMHQWRIPL